MNHLQELHSSFSFVGSCLACSEFCCKYLDLIFISLFHYKSACLLSACIECWHCEAVPRRALLSTHTRCGVEECFKHTLSNPFSLLQSGSCLIIATFQYLTLDEVLTHMGNAGKKGVFNKLDLKSIPKWFFFCDVKLLICSHLSC